MKKTIFIYFLLLVVPAIVMPIAAHLTLEGELARGKQLGLAYLQAQAELAAANVPHLGEMVATGATSPADGRCVGVARAADGRNVYAWWKGEVPRGWLRRRRLHRIEFAVGMGSLVLLVAGAGLLVRSLVKSRNENRRQREFVADFAHRLKTPLTSISLCAELARSGRLTFERQAESTATIVSEAEKLDGIVDEVLGFMEESRRG